ncbi:MAG TPA: metal-dependent hydrolase [Pyrinomonadaceae bacterium]|jgi:inner membrane protein|nr:metal-dependent hydrolase [Pyrinomonadaceae bacterium]
MDNLTHSLVGLTAAKAGLNRLSPGATTLCVLAANAPDIDILVLVFRGRWAFLQHHRGITHSIVGAAALALALPLVFYLGDRILAQLRKREPQVRLKGLILASILTTATHPILDWSNNYGMRFLLPWNPRWFYGDFTFVIDPIFWIVLGAAAFLATSSKRAHLIIWLALAVVPTYLVLVRSASEARVGNANILRLIWIVVLIALVPFYRRGFGRRAGAKIGLAALATVTIYSAGLFVAHAAALRRADAAALAIANKNSEQVVKLAAMPTLANPIEWLCVFETNRATYKFDLSLLRDLPPSQTLVRFEKPAALAATAVEQAERDERAQIFLGFARFPGMRVVGEDCARQTLVQFADLRYTEPGKAPGGGRGSFSLEVPVDCPLPDKLNR